ncbi:DUF4349 domain-containing protein [Dyadobacter diqingensis]|uniref:DUF4349 domain-containing protein n=1 Tax=Dyadobacter diqingensis TaxID=2938121 RepID=UPI0020C43149|nr:DUF4349 domain-containing protein [Dyadobacter diqingensis]
MKILVFFLSLFVFASCAKKPNEEQLAMPVDLAEVPPPAQGGAPQEAVRVNEVSVSRKLIKEGLVLFETPDIEKTRSQIMAAVAANNAYVSADKQNNLADKDSYELTIRIPTANFDAFLNSATKDVLYFDNKEIDVKDVTAEYLDNEARLKTKKEIELRYRQLLSKASTVKDVLSIEKELGDIRTEIESLEGQLKFLADQVQFSTLRINFYKNISTPTVFTYQISAAFARGWENLLTMFLLAIDIWPFLLLGAGIWFGVRKLNKRKVKKADPETVV